MPKINIRKVLFVTIWLLLATVTVVLMVSAYTDNHTKRCKGLTIDIDGPNNHFFVDKQDVINVVKKYAGNNIQGKLIHTFDLNSIEKELEKKSMDS